MLIRLIKYTLFAMTSWLCYNTYFLTPYMYLLLKKKIIKQLSKSSFKTLRMPTGFTVRKALCDTAMKYRHV